MKKEYDDIVEMYGSLKEAQQQSEKLNEHSEKIIVELERENQIMKNEKNRLARANIEKNEKMEVAMK